MAQQNWFNTLNEALEAENLVELWPLGSNLNYGDNVRHMAEVDGRYIHISTHRSDTGMYERPISYDAGAINNNINRRAV